MQLLTSSDSCSLKKKFVLLNFWNYLSASKEKAFRFCAASYLNCETYF